MVPSLHKWELLLIGPHVRLIGNVTGHKYLPEYSLVITSHLISLGKGYGRDPSSDWKLVHSMLDNFNPKAELHDWYLQQLDGYCVVSGISKGHPTFTDGDRICTSEVMKMANGRLRTRNSDYLLVNA
jgi:hypothetical protein